MRSIKCVVVGDGAVGKTSLLISYTTNTFPQDYIPTVFDNYSTTILLPDPYFDEETDDSKNDSQLFKLNLWDTAGQEEYDRLRPLSYPQTDIFLVCFSISEPSSLRNVVDKWYPEIIQNSAIESSEFYRKLGKYPIFLVGTKADLRDSSQENDELSESNSDFVTQDEVDKVVSKCGFIGYVECSAATQSGVRDVFEKSVSTIVYEPERLNKEKLQMEKKLLREQQQKEVKQNEEVKQQRQAQQQQKSKDNLKQASSSSKNRSGENANSKYLKKMKKKSKCVIL